MAIRLLQEAAERGELDPWDVDVIAVVDSFLDQLQVPMAMGNLASTPEDSYERDLADGSEALLAASILIAIKARILEQQILPPEPDGNDMDTLKETTDDGAGELGLAQEWPVPTEEHLRRRLVAEPPLPRPVTLGELIHSIETMASQLEHQDMKTRCRSSPVKGFSRRHAMAEVAALAHGEKLPETTAALDRFLDHWLPGAGEFDALVYAWSQAAQRDLDRDRVGVFWALLFLCSQGRVSLHQDQGLYGPLTIQVLPRNQAMELHPRSLSTSRELSAPRAVA